MACVHSRGRINQFSLSFSLMWYVAMMLLANSLGVPANVVGAREQERAVVSAECIVDVGCRIGVACGIG